MLDRMCLFMCVCVWVRNVLRIALKKLRHERTTKALWVAKQATQYKKYGKKIRDGFSLKILRLCTAHTRFFPLPDKLTDIVNERKKVYMYEYGSFWPLRVIEALLETVKSLEREV